MKYYFAPLEGIGGYVYRNAQAEFFPRADKYFTPFIAPKKNRCFGAREEKDIAPEHNEGICLIPQILTNDAKMFLQTQRELNALGYKEVNLNLGCPSRTVVTKCRGAGMLADLKRLDHFLEEVFEGAQGKISIKTRIGMEEPEEFEQLLAIYKKYPLEELIIHPRVQTDYYKNAPRMETFKKALEECVHKIVYNGDVFTKSHFEQFQTECPSVESVMLGRGVLSDPCLFGELRGQEQLSKDKLKMFHDKLIEDYSRELSGDKNVLYKMKELWFYMAHVFTNHEKHMKKIRKVQRLCDYQEIVRSLFAEQDLQVSTFHG